MKEGEPHADGGKPSRYGRYATLRELPAAYFGARYLARHEDTLAPVRLTVVEAPDDGMLKRLLEGASGRAAGYPPLPLDCAVEQLGTTLLRVTPFHEGGTARELLDVLASRGDALPVEVVLRICTDLIDALSTLEDATRASGVRARCAHGGLHPQAIHIGVDGVTRLLDIGLAAAAAAEPHWSGCTARILYSAPEHCDGDELDARSDIFSLGILLWEMVASRPLFTARDARGARDQMLHAPIPRVFRDRFVRGEPISARLSAVIVRALQREPAARFATFAEAAKALRECGALAERDEVGSLVEHLMGSDLVSAEQMSEVESLDPVADYLFDSPTNPTLRPTVPPDAWSQAMEDIPTVRPGALATEPSTQPDAREAEAQPEPSPEPVRSETGPASGPIPPSGDLARQPIPVYATRRIALIASLATSVALLLLWLLSGRGHPVSIEHHAAAKRLATAPLVTPAPQAQTKPRMGAIPQQEPSKVAIQEQTPEAPPVSTPAATPARPTGRKTSTRRPTTPQKPSRDNGIFTPDDI